MPKSEGIDIRRASLTDASRIAQLHADSWRRHYRGAYSDNYLDRDLDSERRAVWTDRLSTPCGGSFTLIAEQRDRPVGFVHAQPEVDPTWGTLVENLHVSIALQRTGVGTLLLDAVARILRDQHRSSGVYLWVLEQNEAAQAFYLSRGGVVCGRELVLPPGGDPGNLNGSPMKLRISWPNSGPLMLPGLNQRQSRLVR